MWDLRELCCSSLGGAVHICTSSPGAMLNTRTVTQTRRHLLPFLKNTESKLPPGWRQETLSLLLSMTRVWEKRVSGSFVTRNRVCGSFLAEELFTQNPLELEVALSENKTHCKLIQEYWVVIKSRVFLSLRSSDPTKLWTTKATQSQWFLGFCLSHSMNEIHGH